MTTYRVLKDQGVYILVTLVYSYLCALFLKNPILSVFSFSFLSIFCGQQSKVDNLCFTCMLLTMSSNGSDYIWSSNISSKVVERFEQVGDKASCDRYVKAQFPIGLTFQKLFFLVLSNASVYEVVNDKN